MNQRDEKLMWLHQEPTLIAGIDIAKYTHWARVMNLIGIEMGKAFKFDNTRNGFESLVARLRELMVKAQATRVVVAMEPSGHYWKALAQFLMALGIPVVLVNPKHAKRNKETDDNSPSKSDRKDAFTIADMAKQGKFLRCLWLTGTYAELRSLNKARQDRNRQLNKAVNGLHMILDEHFPEFTALFSDPLGKTPLYLLELCPFPEDVRTYSSEADLAAALKEKGLLRTRRKTLSRVLQEAAHSVGVTVGLEGKRLHLKLILQDIHSHLDQLAKIESAMATELQKTGLADYLLSIPGIGVITAAGFLGEIGDPSQYDDWRQIRTLAGLNLADNSSGNHHGQKRISKMGRSHLRSLLYLASVSVLAKNPAFKALYTHFKSRQHNPLRSKQALIAVACKLIRVMFTLATKRKTYNPAEVLGAVRMKQLNLAA